MGLARLAELGDLAAVAELADVISLAAQAHAEGDPERAAAAWAAGAAAVGHGGAPGLERAKAAARAGEPGAAAALRASAPAALTAGAGERQVRRLAAAAQRYCSLRRWPKDAETRRASTRSIAGCRAPSRARRSPAAA